MSENPKLAEAKRLLVEKPDLSILQVAEALGLDYEGLNKLVKVGTGVTPSAYRFQTLKGEQYIPPNIARALYLLLDPDRSINEIADECGYSSSAAFCYRFKQIMGVSPMTCRWQTQLKTEGFPDEIARAFPLLLDTDKSINEIADECGYSNAHTFSRQFKKSAGISPLKWRCRARIENKKFPDNISKAKFLLIYSDQSFSEIAQACGYASRQSLCTGFNRAAGMSPRAFRGQFKEAFHQLSGGRSLTANDFLWAQRVLAKGTLSSADVAAHFHFSSSEAFLKVFEILTGKSFSEWEKENIGENLQGAGSANTLPEEERSEGVRLQPDFDRNKWVTVQRLLDRGIEASVIAELYFDYPSLEKFSSDFEVALGITLERYVARLEQERSLAL